MGKFHRYGWVVFLGLVATGCGGKAPETPSPTPTAVASAAPTVTATPTESATPDEKAKKQKIKELVRSGMDQILVGQEKDSLTYLEQAYQIDPTNGDVHYWMFKAYEKLDEVPNSSSQSAFHARQTVALAEGDSLRQEASDYLRNLPSAITTSQILAIEVANSGSWVDPGVVLVPTKDSDTELWGAKDGEGAWVIKPQFAEMQEFFEGLAAAKDAEKGWGFVSPKGAWVIEPQFFNVGRFSEGVCNVQATSPAAEGEEPKAGLWGYIDHSGKWQIDPTYAQAVNFAGGLASVTRQGAQASAPGGQVDHEGTYYPSRR